MHYYFAAGAALVGGLTKYWTLKINRIRSKRYVPDKQDNSLTVKQQKKLLKSERKNANFRNFATGALNGLLMPIMTLGGIIGARFILQQILFQDISLVKRMMKTKNH